MPTEPVPKRAVAFVDGQNLFHTVKDAFGYTYKNYYPRRLAEAICAAHDWQLQQVRFYTGVPDPGDNALWSHFWGAKLAQMGRQGIWTFSRPLRYQNKLVVLPDGTQHSVLVGQEKGVDVRMALDIVRLILDGGLDVALVFSQDQDLSEVADEVRLIAKRTGRWIKIVSAFPVSPTFRNRRGVNKTDWIPISREIYDACIDPRDYRPKA